MPGFAVDTHPQKQKIIDGILSGMTTRAISSFVVPPIPHSAVQRYKVSVIKPMLERASVSERILNSVPGLKDKPMDLSNAPPEVQAVQQAIQDAPVLSLFRKRHEKVWGVVERTMAKAEAAVRVQRDEDGNEVFAGPDLGVMAPILNQAHKSIEILGRATGELEPQGGQGVSIQIICPAAPNPDAMPRVSYAAPDQIEGAVDDCAVIGVIQK